MELVKVEDFAQRMTEHEILAAKIKVPSPHIPSVLRHNMQLRKIIRDVVDMSNHDAKYNMERHEYNRPAVESIVRFNTWKIKQNLELIRIELSLKRLI